MPCVWDKNARHGATAFRFFLLEDCECEGDGDECEGNVCIAEIALRLLARFDTAQPSTNVRCNPAKGQSIGEKVSEAEGEMEERVPDRSRDSIQH